MKSRTIEFFRDDYVLRRIPAKPDMVVPSENGVRPTTANFDDEELSVFLSQEMDRLGLPWVSALDGHGGFGLVMIKIGDIRKIDGSPLVIKRDPLPNNPAHGLILGNLSKSNRKRLVNLAKWVVLPTMNNERP